jgi:hypothetical protein
MRKLVITTIAGLALAVSSASAEAATKKCRVQSPSGQSGMTITGSKARTLPCSQWQYLVSQAVERGQRSTVSLRVGSDGPTEPTYKRFRCTMSSPTSRNGYTTAITCVSVQRGWATVRYRYVGY